MEVEKIMRTLLKLGANSSTSWPLILGMFSLFCPLPYLRGVLEFVPRVSNVLIICPLPCLRGVLEFAPSVSNDKIMSTFLTLGANSNTPRRHGSGQNNENITNTRGKLEHSTKTWKWTK
jgi:hypothetical protein